MEFYEDWTGPSDVGNNLVLLPRLALLRLKGFSGLGFIKQLMTPAFVELDISPFSADVYDLHSYAEASMKCRENIRILRLRAPYLDPHRLAKMIAHFSNLKEFTLDFIIRPVMTNPEPDAFGALGHSPQDLQVLEVLLTIPAHSPLLPEDRQEAGDRSSLGLLPRIPRRRHRVGGIGGDQT